MAISVSRSAPLVREALDYRSIRQDMIASNIANADTPNYKPRDIDFEQALAAQKESLLGEQSPKLKMAKTDKGHLVPQEETNSFKPTTFFRDGHMARNDGNSVDIDVETTEMSKNSIMFNALINAMKKDSMIYKSVIEASQKLN